jgi:hypothetical protein
MTIEGAVAVAVAEAAAIENPAWEIIQKVPHDNLMGGLMGYGRKTFTPAFYSLDKEVEGAERYIAHRDLITSRYAWAIPAPDSLAFIVSILDGRSVVEIGAGTGYWAWLLSQLGVDVNAYDPAPVGHKKSWFNEERLAKLGGDTSIELVEFHPVAKAGPRAVRLKENRDRVLFVSWPTMDSWAAETVRLFEGDTIIYIGEGPGGCTADSEFFSLVGEGCGCWSDDDCGHSKADALFERIATGPLTQWSGLHDRLEVYLRKAQS